MKYLIITLCCVSSILSYSQQGKAKQRIEAARIALITERLDLSPDQAEKFWPVYHQFTSERRQIRQSYRQEKSSIDLESLTEERHKELLEKEIEFKQKELNLEKEYSQKMLDVISAAQLMALHTAERDFKRMLLERVQKTRKKQPQRGNQQMKEQQKKMRKNN